MAFSSEFIALMSIFLALYRYLGTDPSNMALVSITMGTGMTPDVTPLEKDKNVARVEVESSLVHIYLNEVSL